MSEGGEEAVAPLDVEATRENFADVQARAEAGVVADQYALAEIYARGEGVLQDLVKAYVWFDIAGTGGYAGAAEQRTNVAMQLSEGQFAEAKRLTAHYMAGGAGVQHNDVIDDDANKAAEQNRVGLAFRDGTGVLQDYAQAHAWLNAAAANGHLESAAQRDALAELMPTRLLALAHEQASVFFENETDATAYLEAAKNPGQKVEIAAIKKDEDDGNDSNLEGMDEESPYGRPGVYAALGIGVGLFTEVEDDLENLFDNIGFDINVKVKPAVGLDVRLGYRFSRYVASEVQFQYLPKGEAEAEGTEIASSDSYRVTANAKFYPSDGRFQPYAVFGVGYMKIRVKSDFFNNTSLDDTIISAGAGFDYYLSETMAFTTELGGTITDGDIDGFNQFTFSTGLMYRF
jgi:opacity protein-like surface antigen